MLAILVLIEWELHLKFVIIFITFLNLINYIVSSIKMSSLRMWYAWNVYTYNIHKLHNIKYSCNTFAHFRFRHVLECLFTAHISEVISNPGLTSFSRHVLYRGVWLRAPGSRPMPLHECEPAASCYLHGRTLMCSYSARQNIDLARYIPWTKPITPLSGWILSDFI